MLRAVLVGVGTGLVGTLFKEGAIWLSNARVHLTALMHQYFVLNWSLAAVLSGLLVLVALWLVRRFAPEAGGSGIQEINGALEGTRPLWWRRLLPVKFLGGVLALGSGMVLGREGPTVHMGGSLGKMVTEVTRLPSDQEDILIASGAGAGISVALNAPLAGTLFVIEGFRHRFRYKVVSFNAAMIACIMANIVYRFLLGQAPTIQMEQFPPPPLASLWLFAILGILLGVIGYGFNYFLVRILDLFDNLTGRTHLLAGLGVGALVGLVGWFSPKVIGGGYDTIAWALTTDSLTSLLLTLFLARFVVTLVCYGVGTPGGIFGPLLALATVFSLWFGHHVHSWFPMPAPHPKMFAVAGMAALFVASVRVPLTGIVLAVEMTMNYTLILPLLVTCLLAAIVARGLGGRPIYAVLLERTLKRARQQTGVGGQPDSPT
jgi:CIC family chloride channel protein